MVEPTITNAQGNYLPNTVPVCCNRLPCGVCMLLGRDCPKTVSNQLRDYDVTCSSSAKVNAIERKVAVVIPEAK